MKPFFFQPPHSLQQRDFYLLSDVFRREVKSQLPVDAHIVFWGSDWGLDPADVYPGSDKKLAGTLISQCASRQAASLGNMLVIPLDVHDGGNVAVLVQDIDPAIINKMAPEWLQEFRSSVQKRLEDARKAYVDQVTGLYNNHLLQLCLDQAGRGEEISSVLFLIGCVYRTRSVSTNLKRIVQSGRLIESLTKETLFYLGGNVFALLQENMRRQDFLNLAHRLLGRLKREGMHTVHIGLAVRQSRSPSGNAAILNECWQALEMAERRGPFSFCEASRLRDREGHPLAEPSRNIMSLLKKKWRGVRQFGLVLFRNDNPAATAGSEGSEIEKAIAGCLPDNTFPLSLSSREVYVLLPGYTEKKTLAAAKQVKKKAEKDSQGLSVAAGVCHWPCLNYYKTDMAVNCRKALMHGSLLGSGMITMFDRISLNVSGDYFFDEGDYRQAVRDYRSGVSMAPDDINIMNSLGVALIELNRQNEACGYFDMVLARDPFNFMALVNKGFAQRIRGNGEDALFCLEKASQLQEFRHSSVFSDICLQLGRLYCDAGSYDKAVGVLERLEEQNTGRQEYDLFRLLGEALAGAGNNKKAITALQRAVRYNPHDALSLSILGELYAREEQGDDIALLLCEQAVEIDYSTWQNWYRLAFVQSKMAKDRDALEAVRKCLRRNRKAVDALFLAGSIMEKLGNHGKARGMFQRVLRYSPHHRGAQKALKKSTNTLKG